MLCLTCHGYGELPSQPDADSNSFWSACSTCMGTGREPELREVKERVRAKYEDLMKLAITAMEKGKSA